jgi:hypothetical protein
MLFVSTSPLVYAASGDVKMHARGRWSGRRDAELRGSGRRGRRDAKTLGCRNAPKEGAMCGDASAKEGAMQRWPGLNIMRKNGRNEPVNSEDT